MATIESLRARHEAVQRLYEEKYECLREIQEAALAECLGQGKAPQAHAFLEDKGTLFRFFRKGKFSEPLTLGLLANTLKWRAEQENTWRRQEEPAVLSFHPNVYDKLGRPCLLLRMKNVTRSPDGSLDELKEACKLGWELGRRWLSDLEVLQMVVLLDIEGAGMSNVEAELLPFLLDLLKNHFPGMVGAVFIVNYGWMHSGMWQIVKRILPKTALDRIIFPSQSELLQFFDKEHLLVEHGGAVDPRAGYVSIAQRYAMTDVPFGGTLDQGAAALGQGADALEKTGGALPRNVPQEPETDMTEREEPPSRAHTRSHSMTSLSDAYVSARSSGWNTPGPVRASLLSEHPRASEEIPGVSSAEDDISQDEEVGAFPEGQKCSEPGSPARRAAESEQQLTSSALMVSLSKIHEKITETQAEIESDSGYDDDNEDDDPLRGSRHFIMEGPLPESAAMISTVSPYNEANPYYGYPAVYDAGEVSRVPKSRYVRRRKRDLIKTLTYLSILRFLQVHRNIAYRLTKMIEFILGISLVQTIKSVLRRRKQRQERELREKDRSRFTSVSDFKELYGHLNPFTSFDASASFIYKPTINPEVVYGVALLVLARSPQVAFLAKYIVYKAPASFSSLIFHYTKREIEKMRSP